MLVVALRFVEVAVFDFWLVVTSWLNVGRTLVGRIDVLRLGFRLWLLFLFFFTIGLCSLRDSSLAFDHAQS